MFVLRQKWKNLYRQYWQDYLREDKEYKAKFGSDEGVDGDEDNENAEDFVPSTEEEAVTEAMLRNQFQQPSSSPAKGASSSSKSKAKQHGSKDKDAGENGVSASRTGTVGTVPNSSPAPRRLPTKETPIPIPGTEDIRAGGAKSDALAQGKSTGGSEKRKKKSSGNATVETKTTTPTVDQGQDREAAEEPKRKRARKSKSGADELAADSAVEKDRDGSKVNETDVPAATQDSAGGGSSRKSRKKKGEAGR